MIIGFITSYTIAVQLLMWDWDARLAAMHTVGSLLFRHTFIVIPHAAHSLFFTFFYKFYYISTDTTITGINRPTVEATWLCKWRQNPRKGFRLCLTQYLPHKTIKMLAHIQLQLPK